MYPMCATFNTDRMSPLRRGKFELLQNFSPFTEMANPFERFFGSSHAYHPYRYGLMPQKKPRNSKGKHVWVQHVNLPGYRPDEITVKTKPGFVTIHARSQEEYHDGMACMTETRRHFKLPDGVNEEDLKCIMREDGSLTLKAPVKSKQLPVSSTDKLLPLQKRAENVGNVQTGTVHVDNNKEKTCVMFVNGTKDMHEPKTENTCSASKEPAESAEESKQSEEESKAQPMTDCNSDLRKANDEDTTYTCKVLVEDIDDSDTEIHEDLDNDNVTVTMEESITDGTKSPMRSDMVAESEERPTDLKVSKQKQAAVAEPQPVKVNFDVRNFSPENVKIKRRDSMMFIDAVQEKKEEGFYARYEYHQTVQIPYGAEADKVQAMLMENGHLEVTIPVTHSVEKSRETVETSTRIPIEYL